MALVDPKEGGLPWPKGEAAELLPSAAALRQRLYKLATEGIYLGTSSWKYEGWLNQIYDPQRYETRGRFSEKKFKRDCLAEYAGIFPAVGGDFSFYQFPSERSWAELMAQVPAGFRFGLKIPEEITVDRYPDLPRYGRRAGKANPSFMDAAILGDRLLARLEPYRDRLGVLIFEFGTFHDGPLRESATFAAALDGLLARLPTQRFQFAVEVRNREFVHEGSAYLDCLRSRGVAHCLNSWTRMPSIAEQLAVPGIFTAGHAAARLLLRPGRGYQQAVDRFSPYAKVQEPYPEGRAAIASMIRQCRAERRKLDVFVNNRLEGNAVETIDEVTAEVTKDLS